MEDRATAALTAIVVLVDVKMVLDHEVWGSYVADLWNACKDPRAPRMLIPVAVSHKAHKLHPDVAEDQFIRLTEDQREPVLCNRVTHELCRLALDRKRVPDDQLALTAPPELLIAHHWQNEGRWRPGDIVIYPDPPLGDDELAIVSDLTASGDPAQQVRLITPTMLPYYFEATR